MTVMQGQRMARTILVASVLVAESWRTSAARAQTFRVLHDFQEVPPSYIQAGLVADSSGNLFGTACNGGAYNGGVVMKFDSTNGYAMTILHEFGGTDGTGCPASELLLDGSGNLYGTTTTAGGSDVGSPTVFKLDASNGYSFEPLFRFGVSQGISGIVMDGLGNLFGAGLEGGAYNKGILFELDASNAYSFVKLHDFSGPEGAHPSTTPTLDERGNLYASTSAGGSAGHGTVVMLDGSNGYNLSVLWNFQTQALGDPGGRLVIDAGGDIFGTTQGSASDDGSIYRLRPSTGYTLEVLHHFSGGDGFSPGSMVADAVGNLYGGTLGSTLPNGGGTIFKLDVSNDYALSTLNFMTLPEAGVPIGSLVVDQAGDVFGLTSAGGTANFGIAFELEAANNYALSTLANFAWTSAAYPHAGLTSDLSGNLYGTSVLGGTASQGTVFMLDAGNQFAISLLPFSGEVLANPEAPLIADDQGNLYGTATINSLSGGGGVFKLNSVSGYSLSALSLFSEPGASNPWASVYRDAAGNLFGTTLEGGASDLGTVFKLNASAQYGLETLHEFSGGPDGSYPYAALLPDSAGNLFGTTSGDGDSTSGTVFMLDRASGYGLITLHAFAGTDGSEPYGGLVADVTGNIFGTTRTGGTNGVGTVFMLDASQAYAFSTIHVFTNVPDGGAYPEATLLLDGAGNIYGTTVGGGSVNAGTVFRLAKANNWAFSLVHDFNGADGYGPSGGLIQDSSGNLYGTTRRGGAGGTGVAFQISNAIVSTGPATHLTLSTPTQTTTGLPFAVTVTARDANENVATGYAGTVQFTSSDTSAVLPTDYTFVPADGGSHAFSYAFSLNTAGNESITATDSMNATITGTAVLSVRQAVVTTWTGASSANWSDSGNWSAGVPEQGDTPVFPSGAQNTTSTNDLGAGTVFGSLVFNGTGYAISGNGIGLSGGIQGTGSGNSVGLLIQLVAPQTFSAQQITLNGNLDLQSYTLTTGFSSSMTINGVVSGTGGFTINGSDSFLTLSNPGNSYSGQTTLNGGTLDLFGGRTGSVSGFGFFNGTGTVGSLNLSSGFTGAGLAVIQPGGAAGVLNSDDLILQPAASLTIPIKGPTAGIDYSQVNATGAVLFGGGNLFIILSPSFIPSIGQTFAIVNNDGTDPITGTFGGLPEGSTITLNGAYPFRISYFGGDGNDVVLTSLSGAQPTTTSLTSSPNPSVFGQPVTFTATVSGSGGTPTGNVSFREGGSVLGVAPLSGSTAAFVTSALTAGSHAISALYGGDGTFGSSSSLAVNQVVNTLATAVVSGGGTICAGQTTTIQAALTGASPWSLMWSDGVMQSGATSSPVTRLVDPSVTTTYNVISISNPSGAGTSSGSATVTVNALPIATISPAGPISLPFGGSATLTASAGVAWLWSTGDTTQAITVSTAGSYSVTVTNAAGCSTTSAPAVVTVTTVSADVQVSLSANVSSADIGQDVTLTITVSNAGPNDASGVQVTDLLPSGLAFASAAPFPTDYNPATGVWTIEDGTLSSGATVTLQLVATVTTTGQILDRAAKTAEIEFDPDTTNDSASITIIGQPTADTSLAMTVDNATPHVGQNVTFTLTLANAGPSDADGVQVSDPLPSGLSFVSATPSSGTSYDSQTGFWTVGTLPNGTSATLQLVATVAQPGPLTNTATKTAQTEFDPNSANDSTAASLNAEPTAEIQVQLFVSMLEPLVGQNVTLRVFVTNLGGDQATGLTVTDLLPAGLQFVSSTPPGSSTYDPVTGVWNIGTLPPGSAALQITAKVLQAGMMVDTATKSGENEFDPDPSNNSRSVTFNGQPSADLQVTQSASSPATPIGQNATFTITATNLGPSTADGVQLTDVLPSSLTFVSAMPSQGTYTPGTGLWDLGMLAPNASATLQITATVGQTGSITNTATRSAETETDPNAANDSASVTITGQASADLGLTMTASKTNPAVGTNVTFTIKAANGGPSNATGVQVTDLLPAGLSFVSATPTQGTYTSGTGLWSIGSVNNGATVTLTLVGKVTASGAIANTAARTAENEADLNPVNDTASVTLNKTATTTALVSSVNPSTFGQIVTFTATVSPASATGTITFKKGATILGTASLSGGIAKLTISTLAVGTSSITAAYGGDSTNAPSTSAAVSQKVNKAATTTALAASPTAPYTYGQAITFTATVTSGGGVPGGSVTFKNGGASIGTGTLVGGIATLTVSSLAGGVHSITAVYGGDPSFATSTSPALSLTIGAAGTTTTLGSSQNPSVYKQPVTFTATVTAPGQAPTGNVKFMDGATTLKTVALSGGMASFTTTALAVSSHSITAVYAGTASFATSTSPAVNQVVNPAPTATTLTSSPNPSTAGQSVALTATVTALYATPNGSVTFKDGATTLGTKTLSGGAATLNVTSFASGSHSLTAIYAGNGNFTGSTTSSPVVQVVN